MGGRSTWSLIPHWIAWTATWGMLSLRQTRLEAAISPAILPQIHWVVDNMNWNGDWEVGDTLNIQFQVTKPTKPSFPSRTSPAPRLT